MTRSLDRTNGIGGRRPRTHREAQREWVERFERSGLNARQFAARHGLSGENLAAGFSLTGLGTLAELTARSVAMDLSRHAADADALYVCGGGASAECAP